MAEIECLWLFSLKHGIRRRGGSPGSPLHMDVHLCVCDSAEQGVALGRQPNYREGDCFTRSHKIRKRRDC